MKKVILISAMLMMFMSIGTISAQNRQSNSREGGESYGNTLNLGLGLGYYSYLGAPAPTFNANYEINTAKNFTLAPFASIYAYRTGYYYGYGHYYYHETVIPIGVKGTYYFDKLLKANSKWDFYLAASTGFAIINSYWDNGYTGDKNYFSGANPFFFDAHAGAEYHVNSKIGFYLDLSTGISTVGIAIHR